MRSQFGSSSSANSSDKARLLILAGLFLVLLVATGGVVFVYAGSSRATVKTVLVEKEPEVKMIDVLVPINQIESGQALEPSMFRREARPALGLPSRVVRDFEEIKGTYSRSLVVEGQPLHRDYITNIRPNSPMTVKIPEGYRAVAISTDVRSSVEGWVRPGARVDVVWVSKIQGQPAVTVIVQNAQVLSAERQMDIRNLVNMGQVPSTITLLVTADDAAKIQLAQATGALSLTLRGDTDSGKGERATGSNVTLMTSLIPRGSQEGAPAPPTGPRIQVRDPKTGKVEEFVLREGKLTPVEQ